MLRKALMSLSLALVPAFLHAGSAEATNATGTFVLPIRIDLVSPTIVPTGDQVWCHTRFFLNNNFDFIFEDGNSMATQVSSTEYICKFELPFDWNVSGQVTVVADVLIVNPMVTNPTFAQLNFIRSSSHAAVEVNVVLGANGTIKVPQFEVHL